MYYNLAMLQYVLYQSIPGNRSRSAAETRGRGLSGYNGHSSILYSPTTVATWVELRFDLAVAAPISKLYASSSGFISSCYETTMSTK